VLCIVGTADVGAEYGNARPLDDARMRSLTVNRVQLLDRIDSDLGFVSRLASVGCITWSQREHLINTRQPRHRNATLLDFITRRSVADFQKFLAVLSEDQQYLVPLLITDGGEWVQH